MLARRRQLALPVVLTSSFWLLACALTNKRSRNVLDARGLNNLSRQFRWAGGADAIAGLASQFGLGGS